MSNSTLIMLTMIKYQFLEITAILKCLLYTNIHTNKYCKFILKLLRHVSVSIHHLQGVYSCAGMGYELLQ